MCGFCGEGAFCWRFHTQRLLSSPEMGFYLACSPVPLHLDKLNSRRQFTPPQPQFLSWNDRSFCRVSIPLPTFKKGKWDLRGWKKDLQCMSPLWEQARVGSIPPLLHKGSSYPQLGEFPVCCWGSLSGWEPSFQKGLPLNRGVRQDNAICKRPCLICRRVSIYLPLADSFNPKYMQPCPLSKVTIFLLSEFYILWIFHTDSSQILQQLKPAILKIRFPYSWFTPVLKTLLKFILHSLAMDKHCKIIYLKFTLKCHNPNNTAELKTPTESNGDLFGSQMTWF